jgi:hypothetical protein
MFFCRLSYKEYLSSPSDGCDPILINPWLAKIISIVTENIPVNVHNVEVVRTLLMKWFLLIAVYLFVLFLFAVVLSFLLRLTVSDYPSEIFKLFVIYIQLLFR